MLERTQRRHDNTWWSLRPHASRWHANKRHSPCSRIMIRPLALGSPTPSRTWLGYKQSTCRGLGTAPPLLSPACARGPARSLADPRGTRLPPWHRKKMSGRCIVEDDDDLAPRRGRNSDSISEKDSSRCRDVGADDLQHHPQCVAARDAVLEGAAPSRTLSPPHWRRAARPGLSCGREPIP